MSICMDLNVTVLSFLNRRVAIRYSKIFWWHLVTAVTHGVYVEKDDKVLFDEIAQKYNSIRFNQLRRRCQKDVEEQKKESKYRWERGYNVNVKVNPSFPIDSYNKCLIRKQTGLHREHNLKSEKILISIFDQ